MTTETPPPRAPSSAGAPIDFIQDKKAASLLENLTAVQVLRMIVNNSPPGLDVEEITTFRRMQLRRIVSFYEFYTVAIIAVTVLVWREAPNPAGLAAWWAGAVVAVALLSMIIGIAIRRQLANCASQLKRNIVLLGVLKTIIGVIWSSAFFLPEFQILGTPFWCLLITAIGMSAGAAVIASSAPLTALAFTGPIQAAAQISFAHMELDGAPLAVMGGLYFIVLIVLCFSQFLMFLEGVLERIDCARQERRMRDLLEEYEEHASDWLWRVDAEGVLTYAPPRMSEAAGATGSLVGRKLEDLAVPGAGDSGFALHGALSSKRPFRQVSVAVGDPDDVRRWRVSGRPKITPNGTFQGYFGVCVDGTAVYEAFEARRAAEAAEVEATRLRGRMIASVSHELRTPLNSIIGFAELIEDAATRRRSGEQIGKFASDICGAGGRLLGVIESMLQMAVIDADQAELREDWFELRGLLESVLALQEGLAKARGVALTLGAVPDVFVYGDEQRLWQAVTNIASNAVKYACRDGMAELRASVDAAGALYIDAIDDGPGAPEGRLEDVFQPFTRLEPTDADETQEGLGLGLPIARAFARAHGGDVTLSSRLDAHTCARLSLPAERIQRQGE